MAKSILDYGMGPLKNPPSSKPGGGKIIVPPNATGSGNKIFAPPAGTGSSGANVIQPPSSGGSGSIVQPGGGSVTSAPTYTAPNNTAPTGQGYSAPGMDANGQIDIGSQIDSAISSGKGYQYVQDLLNQRYDKINSNYGQLGQYQNDAISKKAQDYINQGKTNEWKENDRIERERVAAEQQAATDAYIRQITESLGGQKRGVEQDAEKLAREAYLSYMQSMRTAPQALSASGYSGGMADSQLAALQANLQSNQNKIQENKVNAIYGIDQAITDAQMQANVESARQKADMGKAALDAWNSYLSQEKQFDFSREQMAGENARWEKEFGNSQLQTQYNRDKESALTQAGVGNFAALSKLWGLSDQDTATLISDYAQQKQIAATQAARELADWKGQYGDFSDLKNMGVNVSPGALKSGSSGGDGVKKYTQGQYDIAAYAYMNGDRDPSTIAVLTGFSNMSEAAVAASLGVQYGVDQKSQMTNAEFDAFLNGFGRKYGNGSSIQAAEEMWNLFASGRLTQEQYDKTVRMFNFQ